MSRDAQDYPSAEDEVHEPLNDSHSDREAHHDAPVEPTFGGVLGNGSAFEMEPSTYDKLVKEEAKYAALGQKVLDRADIKVNGDRPWDMVVHNPLVCRRIINKGTVGLGESFMEGWWDTRDFLALDVFFQKALEGGIEYYFPNNAKDFANVLKAKMFNPQSKRKSKVVGVQHYDIGNAFFEKMLGPSMQYSCAYWEKTDPATGEKVPIDNLDEAQRTKLKMIGDKLRLKEGLEVLDIGCGWGTLAAFLAETYKVKVTGITISEEQRKSAAERVKDNPDVTILNQDYRDAKFTKKFDRVVSVGMFEHVGPKNYATFFKNVRRLIKDDDPEAVFLLHTIGSKQTMASADQWYLKYIFPGGCLPSIANIGETAQKYFVMEDWHNFGHFYALTLLAWRKNFLEYWKNGLQSKERDQTDSDVFFRMFYYYLSSSAGAFSARDLQLWQIVWSPNGIPGYPSVVRP